tara:strand:- start:19 stop:537 length:519 start_codon:yes stop_codon:yes gene_type:complete
VSTQFEVEHPPEENLLEIEAESGHIDKIKQLLRFNKEQDYQTRVDKSILHFFYQGDLAVTHAFRKFLSKYNIAFNDLGPWTKDSKPNFKSCGHDEIDKINVMKEEKDMKRFISNIRKSQRDQNEISPLALRSIEGYPPSIPIKSQNPLVSVDKIRTMDMDRGQLSQDLNFIP